MQKTSILFMLGLVATLSTTMAIPAYAHEHREIAEKYEATVGFAVEPAFVNEVNGLDLRIAEHESGKPVAGLEKTLQAEVAYGGKSMPIALKAKFGTPGSYVAQFIPTKAGAYAFRVFGAIEGVQVDEKFTSGPNTFSEVRTVAELQFPERVASVDEIQNSMQAVQSQVALLNDVQKSVQNLQALVDSQNGKITQLESSKTQLQDNTSNANTVALGGIAIGTLGLVVGAVGTSLAVKVRKPA